ncbi:hypothetical protein D7X12_40085 [Corallococcus sicarius]|uniref:Uncharacterized protein n=1 Tax=Corallococcus sicarius TaxID=2316726 RepID=A0A3A8M8N8_9BACT|nr:hypothetical protein D7X12_40085 [Corallococcus sicarius]
MEARTYVTQYGFGHEEWLFNLAWVIDGYHYAYLQPVRKSRERLEGTSVKVYLFGIAPNVERYYVGHIAPCEILTDDQAAFALETYEKHGWLEEMREQVEQVAGDVAGLGGVPTDRFNIRFRPNDAELYDPYRRVREGKLDDFRRYLLFDAESPSLSPPPAGKQRKAAATTKSPGSYVRPSTGPVVVDLAHNALQAEIYDALRREHGKDAIVLEEDFVDIKVRLSNRLVFIEIKSVASAKAAIREALGQLLEYAYFEPEDGVHPEFLVVAQGMTTPDVESYLALVRTRFNIPITYRHYVRGSKQFSI